MKYLAFREMVNVFMTEEEAKAEAEEVGGGMICHLLEGEERFGCSYDLAPLADRCVHLQFITRSFLLYVLN